MNGSLRVNGGWVVFWCSSRETGGYGGARSEGEVPLVSWGGAEGRAAPPRAARETAAGFLRSPGLWDPRRARLGVR